GSHLTEPRLQRAEGSVGEALGQAPHHEVVEKPGGGAEIGRGRRDVSDRAPEKGGGPARGAGFVPVGSHRLHATRASGGRNRRQRRPAWRSSIAEGIAAV